MSQNNPYIGRFAPSPTGPLHFGSLVAAVGSYLDAKAHGGQWLVRMEDLDTPRNMPGAADDILRTLQTFGFEWDGEVVYQSARAHLYCDALEILREKNLIYPCACSRKEIADSSIVGIEGPIYPGTCRNGFLDNKKIAQALRLRAHEKLILIKDLYQGEIQQNLAESIGDFVVRRINGIASYQLAVVVDDAAQNINHVVRGADLLNSTPRQVYLQQLLNFTTPQYLHLPVAVNQHGEKLSKQTLAAPLDRLKPIPSLLSALNFLGQALPDTTLSLAECWIWAIQHWSRENIPHKLVSPILFRISS